MVSHRLGITPKCIEMLSTWKGSGNRRKEIETHDWEKSLPPSLMNAWVPAFSIRDSKLIFKTEYWWTEKFH